MAKVRGQSRNIKADPIFQGGRLTDGTGKADKHIGTKPIRTFSGPSLSDSNVGPTRAPYYDSKTQK